MGLNTLPYNVLHLNNCVKINLETPFLSGIKDIDLRADTQINARTFFATVILRMPATLGQWEKDNLKPEQKEEVIKVYDKNNVFA